MAADQLIELGEDAALLNSLLGMLKHREKSNKHLNETCNGKKTRKKFSLKTETQRHRKEEEG